MVRRSVRAIAVAALASGAAAQTSLNVAANLAATLNVRASGLATVLPTSSFFNCAIATPAPQCATLSAEASGTARVSAAFTADIVNVINPAGSASAAIAFNGRASIASNGNVQITYTFDAAFAAAVTPIIRNGAGYTFQSATLYFIGESTASGAANFATSTNGFTAQVNGAAQTVTLVSASATGGMVPRLALRFDYLQDVAGGLFTPTASVFFTDSTSANFVGTVAGVPGQITTILGLNSATMVQAFLPVGSLPPVPTLPPTPTAVPTNPVTGIHDAIHKAIIG